MPDNLIPASPSDADIITEENGAQASAIFSLDKVYRYVLRRKTGIPGFKRLVWLMLNPSTADAFKLDPTVTRCFKRSQRFGANEMIILNLFAMRSPYPKDLYKVEDPIGPFNNHFIKEICNGVSSTTVVCAFGSHPKVASRAQEVVGMLNDKSRLMCLGTTQDGWPVHPLHIAYEEDLRPYVP